MLSFAAVVSSDSVCLYCLFWDGIYFTVLPPFHTYTSTSRTTWYQPRRKWNACAKLHQKGILDAASAQNMSRYRRIIHVLLLTRVIPSLPPLTETLLHYFNLSLYYCNDSLDHVNPESNRNLHKTPTTKVNWKPK